MGYRAARNTAARESTGPRTLIAAAVLAILVALALLVALSASVAYALPADPRAAVPLRQPDGSSFRARLFGDEWYHGYETAHGFTVLRDARSHVWQYARRSGDRLVASGVRVGVPPPGLTPHLRDRAAIALADRQRRAVVRPSARAAAAALSNGGTQRSLVILAQFLDQRSLGTTATQWSQRFFGSSDSVRDYYRAASYGKLTIAPAPETYGTANDGVVGWLTLPMNHPNTDLSDGAERAQLMVRAAIEAAKPYVDFAAFDSNHDGVLTPNELHLTVIAAGWEAATGCGSPSIWAHWWTTGSHTPTVDGVRVGGAGYTAFGEEQCSGSPADAHMATLGVMAHEFGHDLAWPDLYDYDASSWGGVGYWSIMSYGSWNALPGHYDGEDPSGPDAFLRAYQGWLTPRELSGNAPATTLAQVETNADAVQLGFNPGGADWLMDAHSGEGEYFLLENRQRSGYDRALPGCGILIWHIDERASSERANDNDALRLVGLEEADNNSYPFQAADAWLGRKIFDATSAPNSNLHDGSPSGVSAQNFSRSCGASMSVDLAVRSATAITGAATNVTHAAATVSGTINPNGVATSYRFDYGPTVAYGHSTSVADAGAGSRDVPLAADLAGLAASSTYHYRLLALRGGGVAAEGSDRTFMTQAPPVEPRHPPVSITPPLIVGSPTPRATLTCTPGSWSGAASVTYEWLRDSRAVFAGPSYSPGAADVGHLVSCRATATNSDGSASAVSAAVRVLDLTPPRLTALKLAPVSFKAARLGASIGRGRLGALVTFRVDEAATVTFTAERALPGRTVGGRCRRETGANRKARRCTLWAAVKGSFRFTARPGPNRLRFSGRVGRRTLPAGSYRLVARAADRTRNRGQPVRVRFAIRR